MADKYINQEHLLKRIRDEAINQAEQYADRRHPVVLAYADCYSKVQDEPAVDVKLVVKGEKVETDGFDRDWVQWYRCSVCGYDALFIEDNYCSHCGADLRGDNDA